MTLRVPGGLSTMPLLALALPLLSGCVGAAIAVQVVPAAMGTVAIAGADDRSPFRIQKPSGPRRTDEEMAALDAHLLRAECGNADSQFWLASALQNGFNANPNQVEVYKWYLLAEMGGSVEAREKLAALDAAMPAPERAQAAQAVRAWKPRTEGCPTAS